MKSYDVHLVANKYTGSWQSYEVQPIVINPNRIAPTPKHVHVKG